MNNESLRRRKDVGAALGATSATIGLTALGATGAKPVLRRVMKDPVRAAKAVKRVDTAIGHSLIAGAGIGGAAGLNGAAIQRAEAKKLKVAKKPVSKGAHSVMTSTDKFKMGFKGAHLVDSGTARELGNAVRYGRTTRKIGIPVAVIGGGYLAGKQAGKRLGGKTVAKSAFGVDHDVTLGKAYAPYDSEQRRHERAGAVVGAAGVGAVAAGGAAAHQGVKAVRAGKELKALHGVARRATSGPSAAGYKKVAGALKATGKHGGRAAGLAAGGVALAAGGRAINNRQKTQGRSWQGW